MYLSKYLLAAIVYFSCQNTVASVIAVNDVANERIGAIERKILLSATRTKAIVKSIEYSCYVTAAIVQGRSRSEQLIRMNVGVFNGHHKLESQHYIEPGGWELDNNWSLTILTPSKLTVVDLDDRVVSITNDPLNLSSASNSKLLPVVNPFYCECILFWCGDLAIQSRTRPLEDILGSKSTKIRVDLDSRTIFATTTNSEFVFKYSPEHDYAITEWKIIQNDARIEYVCSEHFEIYDSVWFPKKVSRKLWIEGDSGAEPKVREMSATLRHIKLNSLSKEDFRYVAPPGSVVIDIETGENHLVPGGLNHFISKVDDICLSTHGKYRRSGLVSTGYIKFIVAVNIILIIFGVYILWVDRRAQSNSITSS